LKSKYKIGYDHQSVQSVAGKLSCKRTALKRCTKSKSFGTGSWSFEPRPSFQRSSFQGYYYYYYYYGTDFSDAITENCFRGTTMWVAISC